jgi:hypothetical protein
MKVTTDNVKYALISIMELVEKDETYAALFAEVMDDCLSDKLINDTVFSNYHFGGSIKKSA